MFLFLIEIYFGYNLSSSFKLNDDFFEIGKQEKRTQALFNHTEDFILYPDEKTTTLCCWDARNAERQKLLSLGHNGINNNLNIST